jgi:hypothetical protein
MFTSCKDYDDDINDLQAQIDKAALKSDVEALQSQLSSINTAATTAQTTAQQALTKAGANESAIAAVKAIADKNATDVATAITNAAKAQTAADDAAKAAAAAQKTADKAIEDAAKAQSDATEALTRIGKLEATAVTTDQLNKALDELKTSIAASDAVKNLQKEVEAYKAAVNELYTAVVGVDLVESYSYTTGQGYSLAHSDDALEVPLTHGLIGATSVFGDESYQNSNPLINYKKGDDVKDPHGLIVRINPVNADLSKCNIILVNSKGESLADYVTVGTPTRYNNLMTRSANVGSGLWILPLEVANGVSEEAFNAAVSDNEGNKILYAVAVNNTVSSDSARYVTSSYDVTTSYDAYKPATSFDFEVKGTKIAEIKNRWNGTKVVAEDATEKDNPEYAWKSEAATAIAANKSNVEPDNNDARINKSLLSVEVNKPFSLKAFTGYVDNNKTAIDHYYVTLDKENAIESAPSEWNAWSSYQYDGLFTTVPADSVLNVTIKSQSAYGDIIGFRVYAVNRDGTLVDPDGRAFYVYVGDENTTALTGKIYAKSQTGSVSDTLAVSFNSAATYPTTWTVVNADDKNVFPNGAPTFTPVYFDKNGKVTNDLTKATSVSFQVSDVSKIIDGATAQLRLVGTKTVGGSAITVSTVNVALTKVLPTEFPATITFRPKQEVTEGSGEFILYMKPEGGWNATNAANGTTDLNNVFYNLDNNVSFTFAEAKKDGSKIVANPSDTKHVITEATEFIDSKTWHDVVATYTYPNVSLKNVNGTPTVSDVTIKSTKSMSAEFACWETANKYAWGTKTEDKKTTSLAPTLQWTADAKVISSDVATAVSVKNSYNDDFFGGTLGSLLTAGYLTIDQASGVKLTYGEQVNPYFEPTISGSTITFSQKGVQVENAPTADHVENLIITVVDAYAHKAQISLPVTIKTATKAAKRK